MGADQNEIRSLVRDYRRIVKRRSKTDYPLIGVLVKRHGAEVVWDALAVLEARMPVRDPMRYLMGCVRAFAEADIPDQTQSVLEALDLLGDEDGTSSS